MTFRDLMENHADIVYHTIAGGLGVVGIAIAVTAIIRYLSHGTVDAGLWGAFAGLATLAVAFMTGAVGNAKFNPNNS